METRYASRCPAGTCTMRMVSERWSGPAVAGASVGADQEIVERPVQVGAPGAGVGVEQLLLGHRAVVPVAERLEPDHGEPRQQDEGQADAEQDPRPTGAG